MQRRAVDEVKAKLSILDVVAPYVKVQKAGKYYKGLSPFTKEKTPSFFVSPDRGTYYCFSTNQGGDMFTFIESLEGVDFKGALKMLADKAGVALTPVSRKEQERYDALYKALALAEQFYREQLATMPAAKTYAEKRGITAESIRAWGLGAAPDEWRALLTYATNQGCTTETLLEAGLIKEAEGKKGTYYDRFRNRLLFPIRDVAGRTIGFSGRTLGDDAAKYLNSPETPLFKKSEVLYGLDQARQTIRSRGYALIVEGQMDLVLTHQAGFTNTIALSGTACTDEQLAIIERFAPNIMLALDSDRAGIASAEKSAHVALARNMRVKVVPMPEGSDPADVIQESPKRFAELVAGAVHIIEYLTGHVVSTAADERAALLAVEERVLPLLRRITSPLEREHFIKHIARVLDVGVGALQEALGAPVKEQQPAQKSQVPVVTRESVSLVERQVHVLLALRDIYADAAFVKDIDAALVRMFGDIPQEKVAERTRFEVEQSFGETPTPEDIAFTVKECERTHMRAQLKEATQLLKRAESRGDTTEATHLSEKIATLTKALAAL